MLSLWRNILIQNTMISDKPVTPNDIKLTKWQQVFIGFRYNLLKNSIACKHFSRACLLKYNYSFIKTTCLSHTANVMWSFTIPRLFLIYVFNICMCLYFIVMLIKSIVYHFLFILNNGVMLDGEIHLLNFILS